MTSEKRVPKFHPDDVHYPDLESASDWMNQIFNQSGALPRSGGIAKCQLLSGQHSQTLS